VSREYEPVIGIECHVELKTTTKMFCGCRNEFGGEPNTKTCPVCLGMPGALPVPNAKAIEQIVRTGLAFGAEIPAFSKFDRKNYFYPDMPKDYQISQYDMPLTIGGFVKYWLEDGTMKQCRLTRIHLEEDTGKSTHAGSGDGRIAGSSYSLLDFNRAGVPLMECVSEPELHSARDAVAYLESLRRTLLALEVSDVKMEEGSLRCDANVSIRPAGTTQLGTKSEIKNMNSFRSVERAIASEIARQIEILDSGGRVVQETRGWDELHGVTHPMRSKEEAHDYRYFPDPDLLPLELAPSLVADLQKNLPELPDEKKSRFMRDYALSAYDADVLVAERETAEYFEAVAKGRDAKTVANWVINELFGRLNKEAKDIAAAPVAAAQLGTILDLIGEGTISGKIAKDVFEIVWTEGGDPRAIVRERGLQQVTDVSAIEKIVDDIVARNADKLADARTNPKAIGWFVGQVMKASGGKANPQTVNELLKKKIDASV
jgi:aspartyl-tRNA(Asn)/glutamyl-tRNA(Gln) amidotransferase subunit B